MERAIIVFVVCWLLSQISILPTPVKDAVYIVGIIIVLIGVFYPIR